MYTAGGVGAESWYNGWLLSYVITLMNEFVTKLMYHLLFLSNLISDSVLDRWLILEVLLTSLLSTGRMHMISGEVREATCYLQQGLKISNALCLPRR